MYQHLGLPYNSPFVGLFIYSNDYIRLLQNLDLIYTDFRFISHENSKYRDYLPNKNYPIGILGDDIEIHFLHYKSEKEAMEKWKRRLARFDKSNMIVKSCEQNLCTIDDIKNFDKLEYKVKVIFTCKNYPDLLSSCNLPEFEGKDGISECWLVSNKHWNLVKKCNEIVSARTSIIDNLKLIIANELLAYELNLSFGS